MSRRPKTQNEGHSNKDDGRCLGLRDKEVQGTCLRMRDKEVKGYICLRMRDVEGGQVGRMGNSFSSEALRYWQDPTGHHECEIFGRGHEETESGFLWDNCKKNPGHKQFMAAQDFKDKHLPGTLNEKQHERLSSLIDLVVRIRVHWTTERRRDDDDLSEYRGTNRLRVGTGFICSISEPLHDKPCPCNECNGKLGRTYWEFTVQTAQHVVYNTDEAKKTRVDLFYDDESCRHDGRMKSVWAVKTEWADYETDFCRFTCVTHDETLAIRIRSMHLRWLHTGDDLDLTESIRSCVLDGEFGNLLEQGSCKYVMIVSHPHGQPKKVTVGRLIGRRLTDKSKPGIGFKKKRVEYHTATCPGSSGATVFPFYSDYTFSLRDSVLLLEHPWKGPLHSGTYDRTSPYFRHQVNYCDLLTGVLEPMRYWKRRFIWDFNP